MERQIRRLSRPTYRALRSASLHNYMYVIVIYRYPVWVLLTTCSMKEKALRPPLVYHSSNSSRSPGSAPTIMTFHGRETLGYSLLYKLVTQVSCSLLSFVLQCQRPDTWCRTYPAASARWASVVQGQAKWTRHGNHWRTRADTCDDSETVLSASCFVLASRTDMSTVFIRQ